MPVVNRRRKAILSVSGLKGQDLQGRRYWVASRMQAIADSETIYGGDG
jgi:hypothetical protein